MRIELLEEAKQSFIHALDYQLFIYVTIGSGTDESPMWLQLNASRGDDKLTFQNSQKSGISFVIDDIPKEYCKAINDNYDIAYDYFKYLKYTHIRDNCPSVWNELAKGNNGIRINDFLNKYNLI